MPSEKMRRISTVLVALIIGFSLEGLLYGLGMVFFQCGAEGPPPGFSTFWYYLHAPGLRLGVCLAHLVGWWIWQPTGVIIPGMIYSSIAFITIRSLMCLKARRDTSK
jgi:hypothetical protein